MEIKTQPMAAEEATDLDTFVDRVIVPALVERFLAEHNLARPGGRTPLAKPRDAA